MLMYKFYSMKEAYCFVDSITAIVKEFSADYKIEKRILKENEILVFVDTSEATIESEVSTKIKPLLFKKYKGELIQPDREMFELVRLRFHEQYLRCAPLNSFSSSYKICSLVSELEAGGKKFIFIGKEAENYLNSFLAHQFALNYLHFYHPKDLDELEFFMHLAKRRETRFDFVLNSKASFVTYDFLKELLREDSHFINILVCHSDTEESFICPDEYKKIHIKRKIQEISLKANEAAERIGSLDAGNNYIIKITENINSELLTKLGNAIRQSNARIKLILSEQTELGEESFMNCDAIISIQFSERLCSFHPSSLRNCKNLLEITIPCITKCCVDIESLIHEIGHPVKVIINL